MSLNWFNLISYKLHSAYLNVSIDPLVHIWYLQNVSVIFIIQSGNEHKASKKSGKDVCHDLFWPLIDLDWPWSVHRCLEGHIGCRFHGWQENNNEIVFIFCLGIMYADKHQVIYFLCHEIVRKIFILALKTVYDLSYVMMYIHIHNYPQLSLLRESGNMLNGL